MRSPSVDTTTWLHSLTESEEDDGGADIGTARDEILPKIKVSQSEGDVTRQALDLETYDPLSEHVIR
jgi:hypothetical protein